MRCPICDNFVFNKLINLYDDRYGEPNLYSIKECTKCGHYCTFPRIKIISYQVYIVTFIQEKILI